MQSVPMGACIANKNTEKSVTDNRSAVFAQQQQASSERVPVSSHCTKARENQREAAFLLTETIVADQIFFKS